MIYDAKYDGGSRFCGPTSLSVLTGLGTEFITKKLNSKLKRKRIKGVPTWIMWEFLKYTGLKNKVVYDKVKSKDRYTLRSFIDKCTKPNTNYLIVLTKHYIVYRDGKVYCTQFKGQGKDFQESKFLRCRVESVHIISGKIKTYLREKILIAV